MARKTKSFRLTAPLGQREEILRALLTLGYVEIFDAGAPDITSGETWRRADTPASITPSSAAGEARSFSRALERLSEHVRVRRCIFRRKSNGALLDVREYPALLELAGQIEGWDDALQSLTDEKTRLDASAKLLQPWKTLTVPLECGGTATTGVIYGALPRKTDMKALEFGVYDAVQCSQIYEVSAEKRARYIAVLFWREDLPGIVDILLENGFDETDLGGELRNLPEGFCGTAGAALSELDTRLRKISDESAEFKEKFRDAALRREDLRLGCDFAETNARRDAAIAQTLESDTRFRLAGRLPAKREPEVRAVLNRFACELEMTEDERENTAF